MANIEKRETSKGITYRVKVRLKGYGDWNVIYQRFSDWADQGVWYKMLYYFSNDADMEYIMIDSTILRAHACAAGANKKNTEARKTKR